MGCVNSAHRQTRDKLSHHWNFTKMNRWTPVNPSLHSQHEPSFMPELYYRDKRRKKAAPAWKEKHFGAPWKAKYNTHVSHRCSLALQSVNSTTCKQTCSDIKTYNQPWLQTKDRRKARSREHEAQMVRRFRCKSSSSHKWTAELSKEPFQAATKKEQLTILV